MSVVDLKKVNDKNVSKESISKDRVPNTVLQLDTKNETAIKTTGKGTSALYAGYNTGKPNLNSPWAGQFTLGIGTENDNVSFQPSVLLNPNSVQHATVSHNLVASCTDIRLKSFGDNYIAKNRSVAVSNADVVQHRGNEIIELIVGNSNYRSNGSKIGSSGGVHLIKSGRGDLQPMVLGNNLTNTLMDLTSFVNDLSTRILEIRKDLILMKTYLMAHVHVSAVGPTSPSPDLAVTLGASILSDSFEISNAIGNTINLELLKMNHLYPFNAEKITSDDHKLT
jgi:hypothetical protein